MPTEPISDALLFRVFDVKPTKSEERKLRILQAAIRSIAERGFEATTFDAIGKMVKMQRTHVNYYFQSRDELLRTAVRYAIALGQQIIIDHVQDAPSWRDRLSRVIEGPFLWIEKYPEHGPVITIFYHRCSSDSKFRAVQNTIRQGGQDRMAACLDGLVDEKKLSRKEATDLARQIQSLVTGMIINHMTSDYPVPIGTLRKTCVKASLQWVEEAIASKE